MPMSMPLANAPIGLPMPPKMAAVNAMRPLCAPWFATGRSTVMAKMKAAMPANAPPMAKAARIAPFKFTPTIWAAKLFWAQARIERPIFV